MRSSRSIIVVKGAATRSKRDAASGCQLLACHAVTSVRGSSGVIRSAASRSIDCFT
jgi:hypothetical protein